MFSGVTWAVLDHQHTQHVNVLEGKLTELKTKNNGLLSELQHEKQEKQELSKDNEELKATVGKISRGVSFIRGRNMALDEDTAHRYYGTFKKAADKYDLDLDLLLAMGWQESNFNSGSSSVAGAIGIMQVVPSTAKAMGYSPSDLRNPHLNIEIGACYLRYLINHYGGDVDTAVLAYNQGTGNIAKGTYRTWYLTGVKGKLSQVKSLTN